jgi:hypothetical protein
MMKILTDLDRARLAYAKAVCPKDRPFGPWVGERTAHRQSVAIAMENYLAELEKKDGQED